MKTFILILLSAVCGLAQNTLTDSEEKTKIENTGYKTNVLYFNPVHLSKGNITLSYEKFYQQQKSYKIILSGGEKANYILIAFDANYYPSYPSVINYFLGLSALGYESPIITGVPVYHSFNKFSESTDDQYYLGLQLKNGALFRITRNVLFEIDAAIGPAYNLSESKWLAIWAIHLNLGISF